MNIKNTFLKSKSFFKAFDNKMAIWQHSLAKNLWLSELLSAVAVLLGVTYWR